MNNPLVQITDKNLIASGAFCDCYRHPEIPDQCIKIQTDNKKARKRLKTDLAYYKKLHSKQSDLRYIADYLGTCETNLGQGYAYQCVLDGDGCVSKTLEHYLEKDTPETEAILKELHHLAVHLLNNRILISDIHPKNILIQSVDGLQPKPVIVDGIGDKVIITIQNILKSEVHNKIIRRWNRFINLLSDRYPEKLPLIKELYLSKKNIQG